MQSAAAGPGWAGAGEGGGGGGTELSQELGVVLAKGRQVLLREGQRRIRVAAADELDEAQLLQVERQLRPLLQDLRAPRGTSPTAPPSGPRIAYLQLRSTPPPIQTAPSASRSANSGMAWPLVTMDMHCCDSPVSTCPKA